MRTIRTFLMAALVAGLVAAAGSADAQDALKSKTYYFGTHPARTNVTFVSEADIETIHGVSHEMSGSLVVDKTGKSTSGTLSIPVSSMRTGIAKRDEHLRSDAWLDAARYPHVRLAITSATESKTNARLWNYTANLTIKGVTKKMTGTARVSAIPDRFSKSLGGGSWVRVRSSFDVKITDFGVKVMDGLAAKVNSTWTIGIDVYGTTTAPKQATR